MSNFRPRNSDQYEQAVDETAAFIAARWSRKPRAGIILGTGLGDVCRSMAADITLPYEDVPNFPRSTTIGHRGRLICGTIDDVPVLTMDGRYHLYEGYPAGQIAFPVRVMHRLGIEMMIISNAAGGLNPQYAIGEVVAITDHINLMGTNPLIGQTNESSVARCPGMIAPYDARLIDTAQQIARQNNFAANRGIYLGVSGPNYETRAEYRAFRKLGGDLVGMSTVPEAIVAAQLGLRVLALSTVTNVCLPDALTTTDGHVVLESATLAESKVRTIIIGVLRNVFG